MMMIIIIKKKKNELIKNDDNNKNILIQWKNCWNYSPFFLKKFEFNRKIIQKKFWPSKIQKWKKNNLHNHQKKNKVDPHCAFKQNKKMITTTTNNNNICLNLISLCVVYFAINEWMKNEPSSAPLLDMITKIIICGRRNAKKKPGQNHIFFIFFFAFVVVDYDEDYCHHHHHY